MKNLRQLVIILLLLVMAWPVSAQRPVIPAGSSGYLFVPPPSQDSVCIQWSTEGNMGSGHGTNFWGTAYRQPHDTWVYGVALATEQLERYPYLWVYLMQERLVDSTNTCYAIDTVVAELFCFIDRQPVSYADFRFIATFHMYYYDTAPIIVPCYEFYFSEPVLVPANTRFYVGVSHSPYNVYNHLSKDNPYCPILTYHNVKFSSYMRSYHVPQRPNCTWDGLDSTWGMNKVQLPGLVDWTCDRCHTTLAPEAEANFSNFKKYCSYGFFPIVHPPEDSIRIFPRHEHPLKAAAVENFRLTELDSAHAVFSWDTFAPSDWGLVGVNVEAYEVNWAPYTEEYAETDTLMTTDGSCTLNMNFDTAVMYKVRCRAWSHHVCDIHNQDVGGEWSREIMFHTGVEEPDTVTLAKMCRRVDGLRYEGLWGGYPKFAWERCERQTGYEVQYAPAGSSSWRSAATTSSTSCVLHQTLDPGRHYWLRVQAQCDHHCHIHDTLLFGEWSDTLEFCLEPEGIDEVVPAEAQGLFSLAPNPARGSVTVSPTAGEGEYPAVLTVNDAKGSEVMRRKLTDGSPLTLDMGKLPSGSYMVTLTTRSHKTETQRLVLEP